MAETLFRETRRYILRKMHGLLREGCRKLPTERELAGEVFASYATLRLVMKELEQEGFVRRIRGSGTYLEPGAEALLDLALRTRLRLYSSPLTGTPDNDYAALLCDALTRRAAGEGYRVEHEQLALHDEFLARLAREPESCDPVVYLPPTEPFTMRQLGGLARFERVPLVVIDCEFGNINVNNITTDNRRGGMIAARALLDGGCRSAALLLCEPPVRQIIQRVQGFTESAELAGIRVDVWDCGVGASDDRGLLTRRKVLSELRAGNRPDGIFAVSDTGAISAADVLREAGLEPGREIALVGFDGLPAVRKHDPPIASVAQPVAEIGEAVFRFLREWEPGTHVQKLLDPGFEPGGTLPGRKARLA